MDSMHDAFLDFFKKQAILKQKKELKSVEPSKDPLVKNANIASKAAKSGNYGLPWNTYFDIINRGWMTTDLENKIAKFQDFKFVFTDADTFELIHETYRSFFSYCELKCEIDDMVMIKLCKGYKLLMLHESLYQGTFKPSIKDDFMFSFSSECQSVA